jgi:hypothetical protein
MLLQRTIDEEEALWKVIESSTNPVDCEEYRSAFPQGRFAAAVRAKLRQCQVMNPGILEGTWAKGSGKESLTPEPCIGLKRTNVSENAFGGVA